MLSQISQYLFLRFSNRPVFLYFELPLHNTLASQGAFTPATIGGKNRDENAVAGHNIYFPLLP
jgi:hypothetical protein